MDMIYLSNMKGNTHARTNTHAHTYTHTDADTHTRECGYVHEPLLEEDLPSFSCANDDASVSD